MSKAKINFEIEEQVLAHAKAFASKRGVSLSKLVAAFFASLGGESEPRAASQTQKLLADCAVGKVSIADAARELGLQDAGFLLHMMKAEGLPLPTMDPGLAKAQAEASLEALRSMMLPEPKAQTGKGSRGKRTVAA